MTNLTNQSYFLEIYSILTKCHTTEHFLLKFITSSKIFIFKTFFKRTFLMTIRVLSTKTHISEHFFAVIMRSPDIFQIHVNATCQEQSVQNSSNSFYSFSCHTHQKQLYDSGCCFIIDHKMECVNNVMCWIFSAGKCDTVYFISV